MNFLIVFVSLTVLFLVDPIRSESPPETATEGGDKTEKKSCTGHIRKKLKEVIIRSGPSDKTPEVGKVGQGETFTVVGWRTGEEVVGNPTWYKTSNDGWVPARRVIVVNEKGVEKCSHIPVAPKEA